MMLGCFSLHHKTKKFIRIKLAAKIKLVSSYGL